MLYGKKVEPHTNICMYKSAQSISHPPSFLPVSAALQAAFRLSREGGRLQFPWAGFPWPYQPWCSYSDRVGHWEDRLLIASKGNSRPQPPGGQRSLAISFCLVCTCWSVTHFTFVSTKRESRGHTVLAFFLFFFCKQLTLECNKSMWLVTSSIKK